MAFPMLEGVQLLNAARGLLHDITGLGRSAAKGHSSQGVTMSSDDFASLLKAASAGSSTTAATTSATSVPAPPGDRFTNLPPKLAAKLEEEIARFRNELGKYFGELPLQNVPELVLATDSAGKVVVANDNPYKAQIEALFEAHPALSNAFKQLSVNASLVRNAAVAFPFGLSYLKDPQGAVMNLGQSLSGANSPRNFQLTLGPNGVFTSFVDSSGAA